MKWLTVIIWGLWGTYRIGGMICVTCLIDCGKVGNRGNNPHLPPNSSVATLSYQKEARSYSLPKWWHPTTETAPPSLGPSDLQSQSHTAFIYPPNPKEHQSGSLQGFSHVALSSCLANIQLRWQVRLPANTPLRECSLEATSLGVRKIWEVAVFYGHEIPNSAYASQIRYTHSFLVPLLMLSYLPSLTASNGHSF